MNNIQCDVFAVQCSLCNVRCVQYFICVHRVIPFTVFAVYCIHREYCSHFRVLTILGGLIILSLFEIICLLIIVSVFRVYTVKFSELIKV